MDIIGLLYTGPLIKKIIKKTIMGNELVKTLDYYTSNLLISPLDTDYTIFYSYRYSDYILTVDVGALTGALEYIKSLKVNPKTPDIFVAYDHNKIDITDYVKKNAGPEGDFYLGQNFQFNPENDIHIITRDFRFQNLKSLLNSSGSLWDSDTLSTKTV